MGKLSSAEALCATCPKRNILSKGLAHLGLVKAGISCPGSNRVDTVFVHEPTDLLKDAGIAYVKSELTDRRELCGLDEKYVPLDAVATEEFRNDQGRIYVRFFTGNRTAIVTRLAFAGLSKVEDRTEQRRVEFIENEEN